MEAATSARAAHKMAQLPSEVTHVVLYTMKEGVPETWVQNPSHGILVVTLWENKFPSYY